MDFVKEMFKSFYDRYWPLPLFQHPLSDNEINKFNRVVWYCNNSQQPIPDLQKFNSCGEILERDYEDIISHEYHKNGSTAYRVYPCGHAFNDINLLCMIFDHLFMVKPTEENHQKAKEIFNRMAEECLMCAHDDVDAGISVKNIYGIFNGYPGACTTVHIKTTIPKRYLSLLIKGGVYKEGDVVDTNGYRGLGIMICNGTEFEEVPRYEYYPKWSVDKLKKYGYRKLLSGLMWNDCAEFDSFGLENGIEVKSEWYDDSERVAPQVVEKYIFSDGDRTAILHKGVIYLLEKDQNGFFEVKYPFESKEQYEAYVQSNIYLKAKVSDYDYLVFGDSLPYENYKGRVKTRRTIYFTDLNGDNRLNLSSI